MRICLLALVIVTSSFGAAKVLSPSEYWQKTELPRGLVLRFINNQRCSSSQEYLHSCRSALAKAAELAGRETPVADEFEASLAALEALAPMSQQMFRALVIKAHLNFFDPYADVSPAAQKAAAQNSLLKNYAGIGAGIEVFGTQLVVTEILPGSPAEKAGLQVDDVVLATTQNDGSFADLGADLNKAADLISGPVNSKLSLRIRRADVVTELTLRRATVSRPFVTGTLRGSTGYLRIGSFESFSVCTQVARQLDSLKTRGMKNLILDLRGNPGGSTDMAVCVAELFLGARKVVGIKGVSNEIPALAEVMHLDRQLLPAPSLQWEGGCVAGARFTGPMVVLVDQSSASSAEIVAGALQDHDRAWLVGARTFGKGTVQIEEVIPDHPSIVLKYTAARFYQPSGRSNQTIGLVPSFEIGRGFSADAARSWPDETRPLQVESIRRCLTQPVGVDSQLRLAEAVLSCS